MVNIEKQNDKLVQQIACCTMSQFSHRPAECGHHMIGRVNILWRWRLINICPLTVDEHTQLHCGLLDPLFGWQKKFVAENRNKLFANFSATNNVSRVDFAKSCNQYLRQVLADMESGKCNWVDVIEKERSMYGAS